MSASLSSRIIKLIPLALCLMLCSCASQHYHGVAAISKKKLAQIKNAHPRFEPQSKYGNPDTYITRGKRYYTLQSAKGFTQEGIASWYGPGFHEETTANGEKFDMYSMSAAHKTLPLPSYVEVKNLNNQKTIIVRVNDRGPFYDGRIIDLSYVAAAKLGMLSPGTAPVQIKALGPFNTRNANHSPKQYKIQFAAFKSKQKAQALMEKISEDSGFSPLKLIKNPHGYYVIQAGPYSDIDKVRKIHQQGMYLGYKNSYILQK